ncbi:MAG: ABC transporter permease subunit, partial [Parvibaculaceae bacterium]
ANAYHSLIFVTEIQRGGLASHDAGPIEAALALGLGSFAIWTKVILPQLYIRTGPPLVNEFTIVVKGTTLLSVITVVEVLRTAQQIGSATFRPLEPILAAAAVLFLLNFAISRGGNLLERRFADRRM